MLLYYARFFTSEEGIQVAFDHLSDRYSTESLEQLAQQVSNQYWLLGDRLSEQEEVMITLVADPIEAEIVFLTLNQASEKERHRPDTVVARVTNLHTVCRLSTL